MSASLGTDTGSVELITDARTFTQIFEGMRAKLICCAWNFVGSQQEAEDAVSDVYIKALLAVSRRGINRKAVYGYLYRAVRNRTVDYHRGKKLEPLGDDAAKDCDGLAAVISGEVLARVIDLLPVDYRSPIRLVYVARLSAKAAAKEMDITVPALKSRLYRAHIILRGIMVQQGIVPDRYLDMPVVRGRSSQFTPGRRVATQNEALPSPPPIDPTRNVASPVVDKKVSARPNGRRAHPLPTAPKRAKKVAKTKPLLFVPTSPYPSTKALTAAVIAADPNWGSPQEVSQIFHRARRGRQSIQPLPNQLRELLLDLIYEQAEHDDRRARIWIKRLTAEFPPAADTPSHLYLI